MELVDRLYWGALLCRYYFLKRNMTSKTVSLVLGGSGARGLAHIGVIHWLEDNGYDIRSISSCPTFRGADKVSSWELRPTPPTIVVFLSA